jgi:hypothetical protein
LLKRKRPVESVNVSSEVPSYGDADVIEVFAVVGVKDTAFDGAGGGALSGRVASKEE